MNISVHVSDGQVIWVNVGLSPDDDWALLIKLILLTRSHRVLNLSAPRLPSFNNLTLGSGLQRSSLIPEGGGGPAHGDILRFFPVSASFLILTFLKILEQGFSFVD